MEPQELLDQLESWTHRARCEHLVGLGRASASGDNESRSLLAQLQLSQSVYARLLALVSVYGSREGEAVVRALEDPSRTLRRQAVRLAPIVCSDDQILQALERLEDRELSGRLLRGLSKRGRTDAIDAYLEKRLAERPDCVALDRLPFGSSKVVQRHAATIESLGGPVTWRRLAVRHPELTAALLTQELSRTTHLDPRRRWRLHSLLGPLAERAPKPTLAITAKLLESGEGPSQLAQVCRKLVRRLPGETFDVLRRVHESGRPTSPPGAFGILRLDAVAHRLGADRLAYVVEHAWGTLSDDLRARRWLLRLDPATREAVLQTFLQRGRGGWGAFLFRLTGPTTDAALRDRAFLRWTVSARDEVGVVRPPRLEALPGDLRMREARRHLKEVSWLATRPEQRIVFARFLPFAEARDYLTPWLGHPEGEERARALDVLISGVVFHPNSLPDALEIVRARKFEQDPVRCAMLSALAALPLRVYRAEHLPAIGAILQDALEAADLSQETSGHAERLIVRLFRLDGAFGAQALTRLLAVRGSVTLWGLGEGLTEPEVRVLAPALEQLAEAWTTRERAGAVLTLAQSLGKRLRVVEPLLDALQRLGSALPFVSVAGLALALLRKHAPQRFAALVPRLLQEDRSFLLVAAVAQQVSSHRQDLLAPLLDEAPMTGRFATGKTSWVVDYGRGYGRWTERQQRAYAAGLVRLLEDQERDVPTLRFALATLVKLAFQEGAPVIRFASDPRPALREIAVRALPWIDGGQGVPVLLECLGDDRARYAIYALRKSFAEMRPAQVLSHLRAAPTHKVTVAKEVVRLLGELGLEEAFQDLLALERKDNLHRDVRVALLRALWSHLDREETWAAFERAVTDPDWIVASKLTDVPLQRLSPEMDARLVGLFARILARAEPEARLDLLKRVAYLPVRDEKRTLFGRLLDHLATPDPQEAAAALAALFYRMVPEEEESVALRLIQLNSRRRHLLALLAIVESRLGPYAPRFVLGTAQRWLQSLQRDTLLVPQALELGGKLWGWRELSEALLRYSHLGMLHFDAMQAAILCVRHCVHPELLELQLARETDPCLRRLAVEALRNAAGPNKGWSKERRDRLLTYRKDSAAVVAAAAHFTFPPED